MNNINTPTRSKSASHNGQADSDTKKKYEVTLTLVDTKWAKVFIEANSLEEANEKADALEPENIAQWNTCEHYCYVHSVELAQERQDRE